MDQFRIPPPTTDLKLDQSLVGHSCKFCAPITQHILKHDRFQVVHYVSALVSQSNFWKPFLAIQDGQTRLPTTRNPHQGHSHRFQGVYNALDFHITPQILPSPVISPHCSPHCLILMVTNDPPSPSHTRLLPHIPK